MTRRVFGPLVVVLLIATPLGDSRPAASFVAQTMPAPACADEKHGYLDFWIGQWTAFIPAGGSLPGGAVAAKDIEAAAASVERILDGCVYLEHWDTRPLPSGGINRGKGFHHYVVASGDWRQTWVDNAGGEYPSVGKPFERGVRYESERVRADGVKARYRQTIVPIDGGRVRNSGETSIDGGKTWTATYNFVYVRKAG